MLNKAILAVLLFFQLSLIPQEPTTSGPSFICTPCNASCDTLEFEKPGVCTHCNMPLILKENHIFKRESKKVSIAFYLQSGVEVLDFAGPMEVFSYAGYEVFTVSKTKDPIRSQGILKVLPEYDINDAPQADILAFFGGNSGEPTNDKDVIDWVKSQQHIDYYFSVCTGAFVLAESGLLKGKTVTTFHDALDHLEQNYPESKVLKNVRFVDNGNIITTAGISAGIDGALHLVAKISGFNLARKAAYYMEYDKWVPGEGLNLSENDPYINLDYQKFQEYTGTYEFLDGGTVEIKINDREKSLYAIVDARNYPLFYMNRDTFSTLSGDHISFQRNTRNKVTGYRSTKDTISYAKLNR